MPGRYPLLLREAADQTLHLMPISVEVSIAVEVPVLVGSAWGFPLAHRRTGENRDKVTMPST
jgi:hypothetical protein